MMRLTLLFIIALFISCSHYSSEIEDVLNQAGPNRGELEQVLKHYSSHPADSLKLRAAEFLIVNTLKTNDWIHSFADAVNSGNFRRKRNSFVFKSTSLFIFLLTYVITTARSPVKLPSKEYLRAYAQSGAWPGL